jgi:type IV secretory pathway VirB2 component (pilin)
MTVSKLLAWASFAVALLGIVFTGFTIAKWTFGDPQADLLRPAIEFFTGPVWGFCIIAIVLFVGSKVFAYLGE